MSDPFILEDPQDAQDFLNNFNDATRRKGESYFQQGRVGELVCAEPGTVFSTKVQGSYPYDVEMSYEAGEGWNGSCSCPVEVSCKHLYAALRALLAEHRVACVRSLSAGTARQGPKHTLAVKKNQAPPPGPLSESVAAVLGRPLRGEEARFLRKLKEVHTRCATTRRITYWDFDDLGLSLGGHGWDALPIWPAFPQDEHEFWLYLANALVEHGRAFPDFLKPVTDLGAVQERLRRWRRSQEVDRWKQALRSIPAWDGAEARSKRGPYDLRLVLDKTRAVLEWKRPGQEHFEPFKQTHFNQFAADCDEGRLELPTEADLLWQTFHSRLNYGYGPQLHYHDTFSVNLLGRLFRQAALTDRIVNAEGRPVARVTEPLRWELQPAGGEQDDYRLRLVCADGRPLPPLLFTVPGRPPLYVTHEAVFPGPPVQQHVLDPAKENAIPAPALESRAGLNFLHALRVELPPRLRERVRHVSMQVAVRCQLASSYTGSKTEVCLFRVLAESTDGHVREQWNGQAWVSTVPFGRPEPKDEDFFALYDRSVLEQVPQLLEPLGLKYDGYNSVLSLRVTKKFPEVFVPWLKSMPPHVPVQLDGELASLAQEAVSGQVRLDVSEAEIDWFDLRVVLDVSDTTLSPEELKLLLDAKGAFVRLKGKGWRRLQFNLTDEEDERLARLGLNPHELTSEPQRLHALQLADEAAKKFLPEEQVEKIQRRASEIKARVTPDLPGGVTAKLRPYQIDGFHFLAYLATNRFGGILADDMGLGKTLQTLAWLLWVRSHTNGEPRPSLVVCPKSVMDNWHAEAVRFTPALRVKAWSASELDRLLDSLNTADLHVLNYNQLRLLGESLVPVQWLTVILDEGQYIKNPSSQTAQVARALRAQHRLVLTGTPIENRLLDLWSLMAFAMPGALSSRAHFARLFDSKGDSFARRRLSSRVRPFLLRRTKAQVAKDLPDRIEEDLFCEIEGEQKTLYRAELKQAQQLLLRVKTQRELAKERFHFLVSLLRLRQICCHPALVKPDSQAESAKVEALLEQLEPLMDEGHKVLVFSQFVELLNLLKPVLAERGWPQFYLAGETEHRGELVEKFQTAEGAAVFLISLKAGGFGLNLTAASYVVLFDPWWNPAVEAQAIDRTHRIGQTSKVIAYRLLIKDSIEEKIRTLQKQKKALAEDVLGEEKFAQNLTLEDLQYLFAD